MLYPDVKLGILELTSLAMNIQDETNCLVEINIHHSVGIWNVCISHEYDRRLNKEDNLYEANINYGDDYYNQFFEENYKAIRNTLMGILEELKVNTNN